MSLLPYPIVSESLAIRLAGCHLRVKGVFVDKLKQLQMIHVLKEEAKEFVRIQLKPTIDNEIKEKTRYIKGGTKPSHARWDG